MQQRLRVIESFCIDGLFYSVSLYDSNLVLVAKVFGIMFFFYFTFKNSDLQNLPNKEFFFKIANTCKYIKECPVGKTPYSKVNVSCREPKALTWHLQAAIG